MLRVFTCLTEEHDWHLVALAGLVCLLTSLATVSLLHRAGATRERSRGAWLAATGMVGGCGIWATHFIAILAYEPGVAVRYNVGLTILSLAAAIVITGGGLAVGVYAKSAGRAPLAGGVVGAGVASMHYIGMHALEVSGRLSWSADLVVASVVVGAVLVTAALAVAVARQDLRATLLAASLFALAIVSMHFIGMGAVELVFDSEQITSVSALPPSILALAIASVSSAILGMSLIVAIMDQRLDAQHLLLEAALQNVSQGVVMFDAQGRLLLCNERYRTMYEMPRELVKPGRMLREILDYRVATGTFAGDPQHHATQPMLREKAFSREFDLPDGRVILVRTQLRPGGGWVATHEDITELKRREASFRLMFENNPIPMWVTDRASLRFLDVNAAAIAHYGHGREDFLARTLLDISLPEDWTNVRAAVAHKDRAAGRPRRHIKANGEKIEVELYIRSLTFSGCDASLVAAIDVTARKLVENELRSTRSFLDTIINNVPAPIIVREATGDRRHVLINRACEKFFGHTPARVIGKTVREVVPPQAAAIIEARDVELLAQGEALFDDERLLDTPDQGQRYMTAQRLVIRDDNNDPRYLLTVINDVTERRLAADKLRETSELLQAVIDASPIAITGSVPSGAVIIWNRAAEALFGYTADEAIGHLVSELIVPESARQSFDEARAEVFSSESRGNAIEQRKRKDGSIIDVQLASAPVLAHDGTVRAVVVAIEDITERKILEEQLRQSQKMEAIGQLTGGLSHDFNNLLAIIIGNLDLLREQVGWNPDALEAVDEALGASLRGAELNRHLLAFARRQPLQPKSIDLNELVAGMMKLLERTLGEHIEIAVAPATGLWPLLADPAQLGSALTNLLVNSRDAMPQGGALTIATRNVSFDQDDSQAHADVPAGDYVVLEVSDTGTGMPADVVARVFEPFFTTKGMDKGTGLGLSMVFGFVKQSGGHVQVYSEVGIGTTLRLYLPRALDAAADERPEAVEGRPRGHETILAVEDSPSLRHILVRQLKNLGYRVLEAENAKAAMEILASAEKIDLLFTDMVLPGGTNGAQLARMAEAMRSDLKILFTSGFPEGATDRGGALPPGAVLLGKPYRQDQLARQLRESLAA